MAIHRTARRTGTTRRRPKSSGPALRPERRTASQAAKTNPTSWISVRPIVTQSGGLVTLMLESAEASRATAAAPKIPMTTNTIASTTNGAHTGTRGCAGSGAGDGAGAAVMGPPPGYAGARQATRSRARRPAAAAARRCARSERRRGRRRRAAARDQNGAEAGGQRAGHIGHGRVADVPGLLRARAGDGERGLERG